jgi:hypothetical protein
MLTVQLLVDGADDLVGNSFGESEDRSSLQRRDVSSARAERKKQRRRLTMFKCQVTYTPALTSSRKVKYTGLLITAINSFHPNRTRTPYIQTGIWLMELTILLLASR